MDMTGRLNLHTSHNPRQILRTQRTQHSVQERRGAQPRVRCHAQGRASAAHHMPSPRALDPPRDERPQINALHLDPEVHKGTHPVTLPHHHEQVRAVLRVQVLAAEEDELTVAQQRTQPIECADPIDSDQATCGGRRCMHDEEAHLREEVHC